MTNTTTISALVEKYGRAQLGIDGNYGFALLGSDLQEGESEFVAFAPTLKDVESASLDDQLISCKKALQNLRSRLNLPELGWYFGESHPYGK